MSRPAIVSILAGLLLLPGLLRAETGAEAWLRYASLSSEERAKYATLPASLVVLGDSPLLRSAQEEMMRGVSGMLGRTLHQSDVQIQEKCIVLGTLASLKPAAPGLNPPNGLRDDSFWLTEGKVHGLDSIVIAGTTERGVLYGTFAFLRRIARGEDVSALNLIEQPYAPVRWVDQWDNLDGSIERGYAGRSIFFDAGSVRADLKRAGEYARLLASLGINGCTVNNVNANPKALDDNFLPQIARIADAFRPWGVRLSLSVNLSSPKVIGGLNTFDPLDPQVEAWWRSKADQIYRLIPDFGGFVVKADSEGQLGPSTYGRTPAEAANASARALKPHGGIVFYRAFVYNHHLDWREPKNDRARAAYDIFHPLDGKFDDNVIIQIKNGPIDFQVREPASPLFGGLQNTSQAIELQVTQEYTGQQRHLCFLAPMWKEVLDLDFHVQMNAGRTPVKDLVAGRVFHRSLGGFVGVVNVGMDANWLGHPLAMANLYAFGRLAWNPNLNASTIADEWTRLTFGSDPLVASTLTGMLLSSWHVYESYTGPLGAGTLTNITGAHYGPGVESSERNGWGQWHRADHDGVGMDRSVATGTGYTAQYPPAVASMYESAATTPDELLLFFHHVPYTYVLHSGKTVIQHIYDSHYDGAERAQQYVQQWQSLKGHIDDERYAATLERLQYQAGHAIVWRDAVCNWFLRTSGIADAKGRVGHYPGRIEAEAMRLQGYKVLDVVPEESASGGKAVACAPPERSCTAAFTFPGNPGRYDLAVQYFDQSNGQSKFRVLVGDRVVDTWIADDHLPAPRIGADSSTRRWIRGLALRLGDDIRIEGVPDGQEPAALDYVEVHPADVPAQRDAALPPPPQLTAEQDHQRMMELLHIKALRPGANGNDPSAQNAANYDESKANPFPTLPDPLVFNNGKPVKTPAAWQQRRAEIVQYFDREIYGREPRNTPQVKWSVTSTIRESNGDVPVITKKLVGHVDNASYPAINVDIQLTLSTPANATGPVPVIMEFGLSPEFLAALARRRQEMQSKGQQPPPLPEGPTWQQQVLARGWGYATFIPTSVQADNGAGLTQGIIGLCNKGEPRKLDDWGALRAWAWGASRALDYFETDNSVDSKRVGIEGHSRYGKAALIAMAYDQRFAVVFVSSSGEGGAKLHRRNWGEIVENLAGSGEYHWMAGNFIKYAGPLHWNDLPVDSHELIALCAPRPVFISAGAANRGDGWVDAKGMFMAAAAAGPVYRLLGKKDLGTQEFPAIETSLIDGEVAFRQHSAGHTPGPNWPTFLTFAARYFTPEQTVGKAR